MATICFRPPPLPPSRKSPSNSQQRYRGKQHHHLLSSTYLSFRDPAEDEVPTTAEEVELADLKARNGPKRGRKVSHSNSFGREGSRDPRAVMTRSHSEGNLKKIGGGPTNINRYMKVLSGSWRNLLNLGGMSRPPKPAATAKKVAPPAVPHEFRHSGSSFGSSQGYASSEDAAFLAPADPPGLPR
ncbi:unnamed protein product, partial [Callosobruchus maculatus]